MCVCGPVWIELIDGLLDARDAVEGPLGGQAARRLLRERVARPCGGRCSVSIGAVSVAAQLVKELYKTCTVGVNVHGLSCQCFV